MRIHFLGGADEVGASCALVEAGGHRVLVDAGVRMGAAQPDRLPDLARLAELGAPEAVLVTHAHLDHTGALPLVHASFPGVPVWTTPPTAGLLQVLLLDALRVMQAHADSEGELPLYPAPAVEALLARVRTAPFHEPVPLCDGALSATFFPAGHVLGAAAIAIATPEGTVLFTGDFSRTDQLTVPGMPRPRCAPDVVVTESTYGGRLHASRRAEEARLAATVIEVLRAGGKVLIPAFALGRAQEVLLVLRKALAAPDAPQAVVWADGMVRAVCGQYAQSPGYLSPALRERALAGRGVFFTADGRVRPVAAPSEREAILAGPPCVIVASSGMLAGGPSAFYAARLVQDPQALIALTGYQDEEAPGRRLQEVARGERTDLALGGTSTTVRCRVATYALSAHADGEEVAALVTSLGPRAAVLVHGDGDARQALARRLLATGLPEVHLPATGETLVFDRMPARPSRVVRGLAPGRDLDLAALGELARHLREHDPPGRTYTVTDLADRFYGSQDRPADLGALRALLDSAQPCFVADRKRPFLFRVAEQTAGPAEPAVSPRTEGDRMEQNAALAHAERLLGADSGLYRRGAERESWTLRLAFEFPDVARIRLAGTLARIPAETGWNLEIDPQPHLGALEREARAALGSVATLLRPPSVRIDERMVEVVVDAPPDDEAAAAMAGRFRERTGFALRITAEAPRPVVRVAYDDQGRMEFNAALATVDEAFAGLAHRPGRRSRKRDAAGEYLELSFVSPEVGERYRKTIEDLAYRTSWRIQVATSVDQAAVLQAVRELVPAGWAMRRGPGLDVANRTVRLYLVTAPAPGEREAVEQQLRERTGFGLG